MFSVSLAGQEIGPLYREGISMSKAAFDKIASGLNEALEIAGEDGVRSSKLIGPCGPCFRFMVPCSLAIPCYLHADVVLDLNFYDKHNRVLR